MLGPRPSSLLVYCHFGFAWNTRHNLTSGHCAWTSFVLPSTNRYIVALLNLDRPKFLKTSSPSTPDACGLLRHLPACGIFGSANQSSAARESKMRQAERSNAMPESHMLGARDGSTWRLGRHASAASRLLLHHIVLQRLATLPAPLQHPQRTGLLAGKRIMTFEIEACFA